MNVERYGDTLLIDGVQLTSATNRRAEAELVATSIPADASSVWVYGPGLGDTVRVLLKRPTVQRLHVVPMMETIYSLDDADLAWIEDPRVAIEDPTKQNVVYTPFVCNPVELRLSCEAAWSLRDKINALLNEPFNRFIFQNMDDAVWSKHRDANARFVALDPNVLTIPPDPRRHMAVVVPGPTLAKSIGWLKLRQERVGIVASSSALLPLQRAGMRVDYVIIIDRQTAGKLHFDGADKSGMLVYGIDVEPSIPREWTGKRYFVREGQLFCGGSVIHHQMDLARRLGAKQITMIGADFGFPDEKSHIDGCATPFDVSKQGLTLCRNGRGKIIRTDASFAQFRVYAEHYIARHPDIKWGRRGRDGAEMRGIAWVD